MPPVPDWFTWVLLATTVALAIAWWSARTRTGRHNRRRQRHAARGERRAEQLLQRHGYQILDVQVDRAWQLWIDGSPCEVRSRADLLVARDGHHFVAEVKTGLHAPNPTRPATRRQLMEYLWVFPVAGVLLVDIDRASIHEVRWRPPSD